MGRQAVHHERVWRSLQQVRRDPEAGEGPAALRRLFLGPCSPTRRCRRRPPRDGRRGSADLDPRARRSAELARLVDDRLVGLVPCGRRDRARSGPTAAPASSSEWHTLLPSPTNASCRPRSAPRCSRSVSRSASAWHGCSRSESALMTGTRTRPRARSRRSWLSVADHDRVDVPRRRPRDVARAARASPRPTISRRPARRRAAQPRDPDLEADPGAQAGLVEDQRDGGPRAAARDVRPARALSAEGVIDDVSIAAASEVGDERKLRASGALGGQECRPSRGWGDDVLHPAHYDRTCMSMQYSCRATHVNAGLRAATTPALPFYAASQL